LKNKLKMDNNWESYSPPHRYDDQWPVLAMQDLPIPKQVINYIFN
jgi:hypothetical protein